MIKSLKIVGNHRWFFLLALILLFFQPYRIGLKIDPATFGALAKQLVSTGEFWPLKLYEGFFGEFYEHPPLVIWVMSFFMRLPFRDEWTVHLFSRFCCLLTLFLGLLTLRSGVSSPERNTHKKEVAFLFFTLSWMDWIKFAGAGQFEGPLSLWMMGLLYLLSRQEQAGESEGVVSFAKWLMVGLIGFLVKGVFTLPVLGGVFLFQLVQRKRFFFLLTAILGWFLGVGLLYFLDRQFQTAFVNTYFGVQVFGTVFNGGIRGVEPLSFSAWRIISALRTWVEVQIKYSFLWSIPFLIAVIFVLIKKRKAMTAVASLSLVIYFSFMAPIAFAAFKLPHWLVPAYPIGALVLCSVFSWERVSFPAWVEKGFKTLVLVLLLVHSFVPLSTTNRVPRGEEFVLNRDLISNNGLRFNELVLLPDDGKGMPILFQKAYAAFYFLPMMKIKLSSLSNLIQAPCRENLVVVSKENWEINKAQLHELGWIESVIQQGQTKFLYCVL